MDTGIIIYTTEDGLTKVETTFDKDTVWLSLEQMSELFQRDKSTISRHIRKVFDEGELDRNSVVAKFATTASDGKTYNVDYYNLDVIISVGYRVKSQRGVQFRIWASNLLKEYLKKGFVMDDERLKNLGGGGYWKELLERIRDIRASEKMFYRQVLEIYATSIDYDPRNILRTESVISAPCLWTNRRDRSYTERWKRKAAKQRKALFLMRLPARNTCFPDGYWQVFTGSNRSNLLNP